MKPKPRFFRFSLLLLLIALGTAACSLPPHFNGKVVNPLKPAPEISLIDDNGDSFQLSALHGQVVAVFFGYVNCPDECPLTMARLKQSLSFLGDQAQNVQVVLVSTDPLRDTPYAMKIFLDKFNPSFIGIPGELRDLAPIWGEYGVSVLNGGLTHSSYIYIVDPKGNLHLKIDAESTSEEIASDLKNIIALNQD
jgi:protein SCO1